jgi:acyl carrier protein
MENIKDRIKSEIIRVLDLDDEVVAKFNDDTPLFGSDGIGLDSVDSLELVTLIYKNWSINVPTEDMNRLTSVDAIAEYIAEKQK